ncbi:MAG TPA: substrate-binding domain-containing protein [Kofleriaceae bacterium]|jgi:mxaJ protein
MVLLVVFVATGAGGAPRRELRVCADPNNLPFSSDHAPGFENQIAQVLANQLGAKLTYTWWAQRRGFFRNTLKARTCDVVIGVPVGLGMARTTAPYYRSAYAFVSRADRALAVHSLDDPRLRRWKIGVQLVGDDGANTPPVHALARRGIVDNVVGFTVFGDYARQSPPADVVRAVVDGKIDVALVWGPLAGGFARTSATRLAVTPVDQATDSGLALAFDIAVGVRRPDAELAAELDRALVARRGEIQRILDAWRVPRVPPPAGASSHSEAAR